MCSERKQSTLTICYIVKLHFILKLNTKCKTDVQNYAFFWIELKKGCDRLNTENVLRVLPKIWFPPRAQVRPESSTWGFSAQGGVLDEGLPVSFLTIGLMRFSTVETHQNWRSRDASQLRDHVTGKEVCQPIFSKRAGICLWFSFSKLENQYPPSFRTTEEW